MQDKLFKRSVNVDLRHGALFIKVFESKLCSHEKCFIIVINKILLKNH